MWESYVACENWEVGRACGEALAKKMGYKGKVILIEGVTGAQNSIDRIGGAREVIESYPDMEIVASQSGDMNRAKAMEVMQNLLQAHPDVQGVYAINDEMALGCVEAIAAAGRSDQIIVGGCDGNADARTAIRDDKLAFSCDLVPYDQGYQAVAAAAKIVNGEEVEERVVTKMLIIDKDNVDETVN
ncbi:sugar ABC transporter substrate-binding protein [Clostridium sp. AM58-1XD]|nr:sugar ABC transporter substrate-binding protein [Clostridium sp. AM58-1XD]